MGSLLVQYSESKHPHLHVSYGDNSVCKLLPHTWTLLTMGNIPQLQQKLKKKKKEIERDIANIQHIVLSLTEKRFYITGFVMLLTLTPHPPGPSNHSIMTRLVSDPDTVLIIEAFIWQE